MLMDIFNKNAAVAQERSGREKKQRDEAERKRKERVAKKAEEERKRREKLTEGPRLQEVTDEEAERIQKEIDAVSWLWCRKASQKLPLGRRLKVPLSRNNLFKKSFIPSVI